MPRRTATVAARLKLRTAVMQMVVPAMHSVRALSSVLTEECPGEVPWFTGRSNEEAIRGINERQSPSPRGGIYEPF